jgi:hypothetical protein
MHHGIPKADGPFGLGLLSLLDVLDGLTDALDLLGLILWNTDVELFLEFHNQFNRIE